MRKTLKIILLASCLLAKPAGAMRKPAKELKPIERIMQRRQQRYRNRVEEVPRTQEGTTRCFPALSSIGATITSILTFAAILIGMFAQK